MVTKLSIKELKSHYETLFRNFDAGSSDVNFKNFLQNLVQELSLDLGLDISLLLKDYDEEVCKTKKFGALESLKRVLLHVAESANYKATEHPNWSLLAGRLEVQRIKLIVPETLREVLELEPGLWRQDEYDYLSFCRENAEVLEEMMVNERDYDFYFFGIRTLEKSYLVNLTNRGINFIETPQRMYMRVATFLMMPDLEAIKEYYDALSLGYFTHASPTLFNSGLKNGSLASCFLLSMQDDFEKIYDTIKQCALISKATGGIGLEVSNIRHSAIGYRGQSAGIVPLLKVANDTMVYANQEGHRKGSASIFLAVWHVDILDFISLKRQQGKEERRARDLFYALWNCDIFMERVKNNEMWSLFCPHKVPLFTETFGEKFDKIYKKAEEDKLYEMQLPARDIWNELLKTQIETGMPFMANKDTANYTSNQQNLGIIRSSNLCVAGDTFILTDTGYYKIKDLVDRTIRVWNGEEFSETVVRKTGENQELMKIDFSNGSSIKCTPYHKFYVNDGSCQGQEGYIEKRANKLLINDVLIETKYPVIDGKEEIKSVPPDYVPINESVINKLIWIDDQLSLYKNEIKDGHLDIHHFTFPHLIKFKYLLQTLGCNPIVIQHNGAPQLRLSLYELKLLNTIYRDYTFKDPDLWTNTFLSNLSRFDTIDDIKDEPKFIKVIGLSLLDTKEDTFCFTEPKRHMGIFNGVITGQCMEILEVTGDNKIASCNLASLSLDEYVRDGKYDFKALGEKTRLVIRGLNKVIDRTAYPLVKYDVNGKLLDEGPIRPYNLKYRPLGLGVNGMADTLFKLNLAWTDKEAKDLNRDIFATIYYYATLESVDQAKKYGSYHGFYGSPASKGLIKPDLVARNRTRLQVKKDSTLNIEELVEKYLSELSPLYDWNYLRREIKKGLRNSLLVALMPTASSAQIRYKTESFEPMTCNLYVRSVLSGNHLIVNRYMVQDLQNLGMWNKSIINFIMKNEGSIQNLPIDLLPEEKRPLLIRLKQKYMTAFELRQKLMVDMSIDRSFYVCQSQSLNIFIRDPTFAQLTTLHFHAWENGLPTGMYYLRTSPAVEAVKFTLEDEKLSVPLGEKKFTLEGEVDIKKSVICTDEICLSCTS